MWIGKCKHLTVIFVLLYIPTAWSGLPAKLFDGNCDRKTPLTDPVRGYRQTAILDLVLIYQGGVQRMDWTPEEIRPYVVHTNKENVKDWFFDGFLFLEFQDGKGYNFNPGYSGNKQARKQEWEWLSDRLFEDGKAIKALNLSIAEAKKELGDPSFKHKIVIGLPEPFINQQDWGSVNDINLDFSIREHRILACKWYIDLLREKFLESNLEHLQLEGFYWVSEQMTTNDFITVEIGDYIRNKGHMFFWIPYYMSNGYSQWNDYGFDIAYLQPNYFFNKEIADDRIRNACKLAYTHNMGMELEFDSRAMYDNKEDYRGRLINYINTFKEQNVYKNASIAYYEGGKGIYQFSKSKNKEDKEIMDLLHSLVKKRRVRVYESSIYQQDFKKVKFLDETVWTTVGKTDNVKFTPDGLEVSTNGGITIFHTREKMDLKYGNIKIKAKIVADNNDAKINFHLMPSKEMLGSWPNSGELFLMKFDGCNPGKIRVGANTEQMNEINGKIRESVFNWGRQYNQTHVFECKWDEKRITFYIDGLKVNIQEDLFDKKYSNYANFWPFNEEFYLQVSLESDNTNPILLIESIEINK